MATCGLRGCKWRQGRMAMWTCCLSTWAHVKEVLLGYVHMGTLLERMDAYEDGLIGERPHEHAAGAHGHV
eukprot:292985-Chlamydomonas_euryale.AAC.2